MQTHAEEFRSRHLGTRLWKDVDEADRVALCVKFRNESEFKTQLEVAEGTDALRTHDGCFGKAPVQTSGDRPASPTLVPDPYAYISLKASDIFSLRRILRGGSGVRNCKSPGGRL